MSQVHQTYQVMYIQEVILPTPSLFEENMMSALNSFVLFNKAEIINTIQVREESGGEAIDELIHVHCIYQHIKIVTFCLCLCL